MSNLIERIRKARQTRVEVNGKIFLCRRPTDWEVYEIRTGVKNLQMDILEKFVVGWEGFTELDLVPGGDSTVAEFSKELFSEWVQDNPDFWAPLTAAITAEYSAHKLRKEDAAKK